MENASMDMEGAVAVKPSNNKYDTLQVDITALPFRSENKCTKIWLNGQEIRNVQSVDIAADIGSVTTVTIKFLANVAGLAAPEGRS